MTSEMSGSYIRKTALGRFVDLEAIAASHPCIVTASRTHLIVIENLVRHAVQRGETGSGLDAALRRILCGESEHPFYPHRVVLQDASGLPALLDIAALRDVALAKQKAPETITPLRPVDLVVDHSIIAGDTGPGSDMRNLVAEYAENAERFSFLRWAEGAFEKLAIIPPGNGIIHQINLERLASGVAEEDGWIFPETVVGTDSHTPMINGLGVLGWGLGGIEATAVLLGHPICLPAPRVVGLELVGQPAPGLMSMDVALTLAERLRAFGVVDCFLEVFGSGLAHLSVEDRATIANMTPEYGATATLFPLDDTALQYLEQTGRKPAAMRARGYLAETTFFSAAQDGQRHYERRLSINLASLAPRVAGPELPHQACALPEVWKADRAVQSPELGDGDIVLAAITSCTNTSNPRAMIAAGLLARKAVALGLCVPARIKTSLSPGSRTVQHYLNALGLLAPLETLGFAIAGFGCMTCVGNSGDLAPEIAATIQSRKLNVAAIVSGNRNFQGRIHPLIRSNFLASPPLVVAYALAGRMDIDLTTEILSMGPEGPIKLADLWPTDLEISAALAQVGDILGTATPVDRSTWAALPAPQGTCFPWPVDSGYLVRPQFRSSPAQTTVLAGARALLWLGHNVTTDHISPVGRIALDSPAGQSLLASGVPENEFNTYGARRGNAPLMRLGTFANPHLSNRLSGDLPGNWTRHHPSSQMMTIPEASDRYASAGIPLMVIAGKQYGIGSARDWAAKGTKELGVKVVLAESFERIHRTNLAMMGILPLQWHDPLPLEGDEVFHIDVPPEAITPGASLPLCIENATGIHIVHVTCRLDSANEVEQWRNGGFLNMALSRM